MNVELFMNDPTDNFFAAGDEKVSFNDAAWFGAKLRIHPSTADGVMQIKGTLGSGKFQNSLILRQFALREESFGALLLNKQNSKVYKLDHAATEAVKLFLLGQDLDNVSKFLSVDKAKLQKVFNLLEVDEQNEA